MEQDFSKMVLSTKRVKNRHERRNHLQELSRGEISKDLIQALNNSLGNSLNTSKHHRRKISPGRIPSTSQKAISPGRDTCRHIPPRDKLNLDLANHRATYGIEQKSQDENTANYQRAIDKVTDGISAGSIDSKNFNLNKNDDDGPRIINFGAQAPRSNSTKKLNTLFSTSSANKTKKRAKVSRHIPTECIRTLDAPGMKSDYYINPIDWSASENIVAVALNGTVYLWNAQNGDTEELSMTAACNEEANEYISSVKFIKDNGGPTLAIGVSNSKVFLFDITTGNKLRKMEGHADCINALDWNSHILTSSAKDGSIFNHDVRQRHHHVGSYIKHSAQVPGLSWSYCGKYLASGSNDNLALIWDSRKISSKESTPLHTLSSHLACVKAVAWNPRHANVLATGGGTADRCIKIWNAINGNEVSNIKTNSQVCDILFSRDYDEIVSSHGYQMNQLSLWQYPSGKKIVDLYGHEGRALHLSCSPDGSTVCSASEDETLRFWKIFSFDKKKEEKVVKNVVRRRDDNKMLLMPKMR